MNRRNRAFPTGVFISQRYNRQSGLCSGPDFWKKFVIQSLPFTIFLLIGAFIFTMYFNSSESGLSPESDWCCKEQRLKSERNIKNRRMISKIILAIIGFINLCLIVTTAYICIQRKKNARQVITRPNTGQAAGSTTQGGSDNVTTTTQYPSPYGFQQPAYGQTPEYPSGSGPYTSTPAEYASYPTVPAYPPSTQYPYNSSQSGPQSVSSTELPPPPSYESIVGQSNSAPSAPPETQVC